MSGHPVLTQLDSLTAAPGRLSLWSLHQVTRKCESSKQYQVQKAVMADIGLDVVKAFKNITSMSGCVCGFST